MNKLKWMVTSITMVGLVALTSTTAFADDGGQGWHSHQGWGFGSGGGFGGGFTNPGPPNMPPGNSGSATVRLSSGWNLVDEAVSSALSTQGIQVYSDYWNGQSYQSSASSAADGMWVYVPMGMTVSLPSASGSGSNVTIGAKSWGMLGNPFAAPVSVTLQAGDVAYTYSSNSGNYSQGMTGTLTLLPGQGAWVYSAAGGSYTVGMQPPAPPSGGSSVTGSVYGTTS